jgi:hypothetical protein
MKRDTNYWHEYQTTVEMRKRCLYLVAELETWDIRPYRRSRIALHKSIKFTYNMKRLNHIHDMLEARLENAMLAKLSEGL